MIYCAALQYDGTVNQDIRHCMLHSALRSAVIFIHRAGQRAALGGRGRLSSDPRRVCWTSVTMTRCVTRGTGRVTGASGRQGEEPCDSVKFCWSGVKWSRVEGIRSSVSSYRRTLSVLHLASLPEDLWLEC